MYRHAIDDELMLQQRFQEALGTVTPEMIRNCHRSLLQRLRTCVEEEGGYIENSIH
ncbi:GSCOCG00011819001-RA-CDS [Cotesia congregata]|nr:GSCOCG00011819001-RA-CDS [Cotesia congregata]